MSLRILTYNIKDDGIGCESFIAEMLRTARPDVAILQEVDHAATARRFAQALDMDYCFAAGNSIHHLALLSRLPIVRHNSYHPRSLHTTLLEAILEYAPNHYLHVFGLHLIAQPFIAFELWRRREVRTILRRIKTCLAEPCVIAGDFNAIAPEDQPAIKAWPLRLKLMLALQAGHIFRAAIGQMYVAGLTDCYRALHPEEDGFTLPTRAPNTRLDYIFVNDALKNALRTCFVIRQPDAVDHASDHYPVVVELDL